MLDTEKGQLPGQYAAGSSAGKGCGSMVDKSKVGAFIAARRRSRGLTQRQLAERLHVSDKAVSKWERGHSLPDIELLEPLADALNATVTELLRGEALPPETALPLGEVESLVSDSLRLSHGRPEQERAARRKYQICWLAMTAAICAEFFVLYLLSGRPERFVLTSLEQGGSLAMALLGCGLAITLAMTEETLPAYYDENIIRGYNNGFFRIQLMGMRISNRNWRAIKRCGFWSMLVWSLVFPGADYALAAFVPAYGGNVRWGVNLFGTLAAVFVPMMLAAWWGGKREKMPEN